jgi:hypothetical protein
MIIATLVIRLHATVRNVITTGAAILDRRRIHPIIVNTEAKVQTDRMIK